MSATEDSYRTSLFLKLSLVIALLAIILTVIGSGYRSFKHYVEQDPNFCAMCHVTQNHYSLWTQNAHHNIACQECHHQTQDEMFALMQRFALGTDDGLPLHSPIVRSSSCSYCHRNSDQNWPQIGGSIGHQLHVERAKIDCLRCHAQSIHGFQNLYTTCADPDCHSPHEALASGMKDLHCIACHNFLDRKTNLTPDSRVCVNCHRNSGVKTPAFSNGAPMKQLPCAVCHTTTDNHMRNCISGCHDAIQDSPIHQLPSHGHCTDCHKPHTWNPQEDACTACHRAPRNACNHQDKCWKCHPNIPFRGAP